MRERARCSLSPNVELIQPHGTLSAKLIGAQQQEPVNISLELSSSLNCLSDMWVDSMSFLFY